MSSSSRSEAFGKESCATEEVNEEEERCLFAEFRVGVEE
jgi:hypothetical protein